MPSRAPRAFLVSLGFKLRCCGALVSGCTTGDGMPGPKPTGAETHSPGTGDATSGTAATSGTGGAGATTGGNRGAGGAGATTGGNQGTGGAAANTGGKASGSGGAASGTGGNEATDAAAHLKYFGYYFVDVELDDPHDAVAKTNFSDEVGAFSNVAQMTAYYPSQDLKSRIDTMNSYCMKPFIAIQDVFHYRVDDSQAPSGHRYHLYDDFQARWGTFKATNGTALTPGKVAAFYLVDEPTWNGVTFAELDAVSQTIKTDYPNIPILLVEAYPTLINLQVPVSVDWVGFDRYAVFDPLPSKNASFLADIATLKSKLSSPHQKVFLTIDDRWEPLYATLGIATPEQMIPVIQDYYDLAVSDPMVVGLLGYLWAGGIGGGQELGVRDMPQSVIDLNQQLGAKIKLNGPACGN